MAGTLSIRDLLERADNRLAASSARDVAEGVKLGVDAGWRLVRGHVFDRPDLDGPWFR